MNTIMTLTNFTLFINFIYLHLSAVKTLRGREIYNRTRAVEKKKREDREPSKNKDSIFFILFFLFSFVPINLPFSAHIFSRTRNLQGIGTMAILFLNC